MGTTNIDLNYNSTNELLRQYRGGGGNNSLVYDM
jgi:hypothetical protein